MMKYEIWVTPSPSSRFLIPHNQSTIRGQLFHTWFDWCCGENEMDLFGSDSSPHALEKRKLSSSSTRDGSFAEAEVWIVILTQPLKLSFAVSNHPLLVLSFDPSPYFFKPILKGLGAHPVPREFPDVSQNGKSTLNKHVVFKTALLQNCHGQ